MPYFALFEMFGPAVETAGYIATVLGLLLGVISKEVAILFFVVSVLFGIVLSTSAVLLEEFTHHASRITFLPSTSPAPRTPLRFPPPSCFCRGRGRVPQGRAARARKMVVEPSRSAP